MRIVTGYVNGKPQYRDEGPAFARVQGHGGAALGQATVTFVVHHRAPVPLGRHICGITMPQTRELCARLAGHRDSHRSAAWKVRDAMRRRAS